MKKSWLLALSLVLVPGTSRAANESLSGDFQAMMDWLSGQAVQPVAFNAGTTFDPPQELKPGELQLEPTFGMGILPLDITKFPTLKNQTLNDQHVGSFFPQRVPFPDMTAHVRYGLPGRWDLSFRLSNVTIPTIAMTAQTKVSGQVNNFGFQARKFFGGRGEDPSLSLSAHANWLVGHFNFGNTMKDVALGDLTSNAANSGSMAWNLGSVGVNAVVSRSYGHWVPFVGVGYNLASGSLKATMRTDFDTYLAAPAMSAQSSRPRSQNIRVLFGTEVVRTSAANLFLSGEWQALGTGGGGETFNVHLGAILPLRFGARKEREEKKAYTMEGRKPDPKKLGKQELIFIR